MEKNKLYEFDVVKSMKGGDNGVTEIKTGNIVVQLENAKLHITVEYGELKIYKSDTTSTNKIMITPETSNVITVK